MASLPVWFIKIPGVWKGLACGLVFSVAGWAGSPAVQAHPRTNDRFPDLHRRVDELLEAEGLENDDVSLVLFSRKTSQLLYTKGAKKLRVAASNAKLATIFGALRRLRPNYQWKTAFFQATPPPRGDGPSAPGLLVQGGGDPTLSTATMASLAVELKAKGLRSVEGPLYHDGSMFDQVLFPAAWGEVIGKQSWYAPVSPFIVDKNTVEFFIATGMEKAGIQVVPKAPDAFLRVVSHLSPNPETEWLRIYVEQQWGSQGGTFTFNGQVPQSPGLYTFSTAVGDPVAYFFHRLRAALHHVGIKGEMPLRPLPAGKFTQRLLHVQFSPPLREIISEVNKESNNLTAEVVLRALALTRTTDRASGEIGLAVLREILAQDFPEFENEMRFADGSGLSRQTFLSARFLVHLLNQVLEWQEFRSEFVSSLSLAGWDGTLKFRHYPERMWGRMRAKSGTLKGVQNLSGYLYPLKDLVVFSFLINNEKRGFLALQAAQDRVMMGIFDFILAREAPQSAGVKNVLPPAGKKRGPESQLPATAKAKEPLKISSETGEKAVSARKAAEEETHVILVPPPPSRKPER